MNSRSLQGSWVLPAGIVAFFSLAGSAVAASPSNFYAGKTIKIVVATGASGGFTIYSRLIANYLGKYIPGSPRIVVENMPGAGGSKAASWLYNQAPRDGLAIADLTPDSLTDPLFGRKTPIKATGFSYLGGAEKSTRLCIVASHSKVKTFAQARKQKMIIGATQLGGPTADYANFIKHGAGAKFHIVLGYSGPGSLYLAMQRGEIDGACGLDWDALKSQQGQQLRDKKIGVLLQINVKPDPELSALGAPQPWPYMHDTLDRKAVKLMVNFQEAFGKPYVAPPGVPANRLAILIHAFAAVLKDRNLLDDARKMHISINYISASTLTKAIGDLYGASDKTIDRLAKLTGDKS